MTSNKFRISIWSAWVSGFCQAKKIKFLFSFLSFYGYNTAWTGLLTKYSECDLYKSWSTWLKYLSKVNYSQNVRLFKLELQKRETAVSPRHRYLWKGLYIFGLKLYFLFKKNIIYLFRPNMCIGWDKNTQIFFFFFLCDIFSEQQTSYILFILWIVSSQMYWLWTF